MFSAITSYIWGEGDDQVVPECPLQVDDTKTDEEWILIDLSSCRNPGRKKRGAGDPKASSDLGVAESWYVTPPPCFEGSPVEMEENPLEDLLIEHPSMSVYGPRTRSQTRSTSRENSASEGGERDMQTVPRRHNRRTIQFQAQLELIEKKRQVEPPKVGCFRPNRKNMKRQNKVQFQESRSRRTKKHDRMVGKHIGLNGKRGG